MRDPTPRAAFAIVVALVTASLALASVWALVLPIFLSPDEDSHYDYAVGLYAAGRPMRPAENVVGRDTQPVVAYLMAATHARQQRLDKMVGADPGYGTAAYFRKLDAGAPRTVAGSSYARRIEPVPYIARLYPIGYYALVAGTIAVADRLTHGSALVEFFSARFLSVVLLLSTLPFSWLALRELGIGRLRALLLFACTALLPLTAWMAGYVQPDNLVCALLAPIFYFALRRRRKPREPAALPLIGILLAALVVTKSHYFVAAYVPIVAMLAARRRFRLSRAAIAGFSWLTVPAAVAYAVANRWLEEAPGGGGVCAGPSAFSLALARGPGFLAHYFARGISNTVTQSFFPSSGVESFWIAYSAYRTNDLVLGSASITKLAVAAIPAFSLVVALLFLIRVVRVAVRLLAVARHRSWVSAVRVATNNAIVNAYFTYFAILLVVEMYLGGYVPVQGRYWLPFVSAIWLMTVTMAPRALPHRYARPVSGILLTMILAFDVTASAFTFASLRERFYGPVRFDPVQANETLADITANASAGRITFTGAAIDLRDAAPAARVVVRVDGHTDLLARAMPRPDIVCDMEATLLDSGFQTSVARASLRAGAHVATLYVATPWSETLVDTGASTSFTL